MLNPFYWYSTIWILVYILYLPGYSAINQSLSVELNIFFVITISLSAIIGFIFRNVFRYKSISHSALKINDWIIGFILMMMFADLLYMKQIPFVAILTGATAYADESLYGMPFIHGFNTNLIIFYSSYLCYVFLETGNKKIIWRVIVILIPLIVMFQKGILISIAFIIINLVVSKQLSEKKFFSKKFLFFMVIGVMSLLYINGVFSNMRSGYSWNDSSYIERVARITNWPQWLPGQFIWAYTYITTPLGNLNTLLNVYNWFNGMVHIDILQLFGTVVPITLWKQIFGSVTHGMDYMTMLTTEYINASSGFSDSVSIGGIFGIWFFYIAILVIVVVLGYCVNKTIDIAIPSYAVLSMMVAFCFFYDTFKTAATSLLPFIILIFILNRKFKIKMR